jgi:hypothetical protein
MKLRYHTVQNNVDNQVIRQFVADNQVTMEQAKRMLYDKSPTVLQYWDGHAEEWVTVPYVTEYR